MAIVGGWASVMMKYDGWIRKCVRTGWVMFDGVIRGLVR